MATTDETFDPNDLDSIDALLDEAELEASPDDLDGLDDEFPDKEVSAEAETVDSNAEKPMPEEDLLDSLDDSVADDEPEVVAVSEPIMEESAKKEVVSDSDTDDFFAKRAAAQSAQNTNMATKDMDSIKKLIIIFGSVLSVLALTGIGIGVWGALSASSAGMSEETQTLIESIKVSSEQNGSAVEATEKTSKSLEKKLDAINFQLEQLATDMAKLDSTADKKEESIDPLGLNSQQPTQNTKDNGQSKAGNHSVANAHAMPAMSAENPEFMKKMDSVNSKLIKAQRRIDEVNSRVKKIQNHYQALVHSVKTVEKQVLLEQAEKAEKAALAKEAGNKNRYQYSAPDGGFYDQSVSDSYP
ncbi:hypothetical protein [Thiomicrorhabdus lithotrophica]|uniref:Uncharacterized protein n=1 Tax=Thiomicrorhabdus lithotrophica TaxID=2949997 RepID=A0ABY8CBI4_9GAMM|nr:hypothetical protein [Thiomicrorhabdus lithotrophica]WEJ63336.1 hypothetical protein NR989_03525 [Thiomicrorhabdus lithotrophica]